MHHVRAFALFPEFPWKVSYFILESLLYQYSDIARLVLLYTVYSSRWIKKIKFFTFSSSDFGASYTDIEYTIGPIPELLLLLLFQTELIPYSTQH